jgi:RNA polymerase sigma factor (sigma-70 family)
MGDRGLNRIMQRMRGLVEVHHQDAPDAQLIAQFVNQRDETAFTTLLRRHGPMVRAVCLRELHDVNDAEDAFQATFMVFVRKANTLSQRERVASWLHGVAQRIARKARVLQVRRRAVALDLRDVAAPEMMCDLAWRELQFVLDEEIGGLPAKYRDPIVLCYLEGLTYSAAANRLGVPAGTVSGRLDRARDLLRTRLVRRGLTLSAGLLGTLLAQNATSAAVPPALLQSTMEVGLAFNGLGAGSISGKALLLAEGALRSFLFAKVKVVAGFLLASVVMVAGGYGLHRFIVAKETGPAHAVQENDPKSVPTNQADVKARSVAQQVVDRAILAMGGKEKAASLKSVSWTTVWNPGEEAERKQRVTATGHDQYRIEFEQIRNGKPHVDLYIVNKDVGWRRAHDGNVAQVPPEGLAANKEHFYGQRLGELLGLQAEEKISLTLTGEKKFDQRSVTGIRVEQKGFPTVHLYFDKTTGLLHRSETILSARADSTSSTLVYLFEDYRLDGGVLHYTRLISKLDEEPEVVAHIRDFQVLDKTPAHLFERP